MDTVSMPVAARSQDKVSRHTASPRIPDNSSSATPDRRYIQANVICRHCEDAGFVYKIGVGSYAFLRGNPLDAVTSPYSHGYPWLNSTCRDGDAGDTPVASWAWRQVPAPDRASIPPRGLSWETTRHQHYRMYLADRPVGEAITHATAFLTELASSALGRCGSVSVGPPQRTARSTP
jgi:hypothetical protein